MQRPYARVEPKAWQGATFDQLRPRGLEALLAACYLMTSPHSNMLGLYKQPILYMAYETALGEEGATKALQHCIDVGFCSFDTTTQMVWVHEMARYQIGEELKPGDLRCKGIQRTYDALPQNPFLGAFFDQYAVAFHLTARREFGDPRQGSLIGPYQAPSQGPSIAPSKPRTGAGAGTGAGKKASPSSATERLPTCPYEAIVDLYMEVLPRPPFAGVSVLDDKRKKVILECWQWILTSLKVDKTRRAETAEQAMEWLRVFFERAKANDFLMGRLPRDEKHRNWKPDIEYLLRPDGIKQVLEKTAEAHT